LLYKIFMHRGGPEILAENEMVKKERGLMKTSWGLPLAHRFSMQKRDMACSQNRSGGRPAARPLNA
jgi:hypothetical protein